ncbi:MAG TPA: L-2-hydroxyglutarate oxidase, partial [Devosia sp.]|nr:L-2-hydroxyglutarate oxidase [Devosia sp.]
YYEPGSLKARLCLEGATATTEFCQQHDIPFSICGKLIVATNAHEQARIEALFTRAKSNGAEIEAVSAGHLRELEPNIDGVGAILSPRTGIVDYPAMVAKMAALLQQAGAQIVYGVDVERIAETGAFVEIGDGDQSWRARKLVVCGGLQADRLAHLAGAKADFRIVPFRGEYFKLPPAKNQIINHLIYPAPDPAMPFLGIHLTRMIDGSVTVGPNAVLGFAREGYAKGSIRPADIADFVGFPGFWKLIWAQRGHAVNELYRSFWKPGYLAEVVKYCPSLTLADLQPASAGIRAQAVLANGQLVHDFLFAETARTLHVCNAPSPAATAAIPIGTMIADRLAA